MYRQSKEEFHSKMSGLFYVIGLDSVKRALFYVIWLGSVRGFQLGNSILGECHCRNNGYGYRMNNGSQLGKRRDSFYINRLYAPVETPVTVQTR